MRRAAPGSCTSSRHLALRPGAEPAGTGEATVLQGDLGYLAYELRWNDNRTVVVNFGVPAWDRELRALRHEAAWTAAVRSIPALAPWIEPERADPVGPVEAMGGLRNTWRRFLAGGAPVLEGLHVIGDALRHTNPSYGKGSSLALAHAFALADALAAHPRDPAAQAVALDHAVAEEVRQWYEFAVATDAWRRRAWRGEAPPAPMPEEDPYGFLRAVLPAVARTDPVVFRAHARQLHVLDLPAAVLRNADLLARARAVAEARRREDGTPPVPLGPARPALLALLPAPAHRAVRRRVDRHPVHPAQVEHQPALADGEPGVVVPAAADGELQPVGPGESDRPGHVGGALAARDHRRAAVDRAVAHGPGRVVGGVTRQQDLATEGHPQLPGVPVIDLRH